MMYNKKIVGIVALAATIFMSGIMVLAKTDRPITISLGSQEEILNESLAINDIETVDRFDGSYWIDKNRILGRRNQSDIKKENQRSEICIYDIENKSFETLVVSDNDELLLVGDLFDGGKFVYSQLIDGDLKKGRYKFFVYDLNKAESEMLSSNMTSSSNRNTNGEMLIAEGWSLRVIDLNGKNEIIKLPDALVNKLQDFSYFGFEDYCDLYYKNEKLEGNRLSQIQSNYKVDVKNNRINYVEWINSSEVFLKTNNTKEWIYDFNLKSYRQPSLKEHELVFPKHTKKSKVVDYKYEAMSDGESVVTLYSLDLNGNKKKVIDSGDIYRMSMSPDNKKIAYCKNVNDHKEHGFIYDLEKEKGIEIFAPIAWEANWSNNSNQFFMSARKKDDKGILNYCTSIIKLNQ